MTRKDFQAAARIARGYVYPHRLSIAEAFAAFFAVNAPAFDRDRFFAACALTVDGQSVHLAASPAHVN
jgi:hypothetical protein